MYKFPQFSNYRRSVVVGFFMSLALVLISCVQVRLLTYPKSFTWLDTDDVQGVMHEMAISLNHIDRVIAASVRNPNADRTRKNIVSELENIEQLAISLSTNTNTGETRDTSRPSTNHLLIDDHMEEFIEQIMRARLMAESEPPNYFSAGQISGNCNACHRMR